jgi:metallophosphoesterase superfamily enzyme
MPAFNELVGGLSINGSGKSLMGPILRSGGVDLDNAEVYLLDGTYIGIVKRLRAQMA